MAREIKEDLINLDTEIGGNMFDWLNISNLKEPTEYEVIEFTQDEVFNKKTNQSYGKRIIFCLCDNKGYGYKLADWNIKIQQKVKLSELIGKKVILTPYDEKKVILSF